MSICMSARIWVTSERMDHVRLARIPLLRLVPLRRETKGAFQR